LGLSSMLRALVLALACSSATGWWANPLKAWGNPLGRTETIRRPAVTPVEHEPFDKMEWIFKYFDDDRNGFLNKEELKNAFEAIGQPVTDSTLEHSFSLIDTNHDGKISLDEFRVMVAQNVIPSLATASMRDNDHVFAANEDASAVYGTSFRDAKLAAENPKAYCADRCLATGFCDALEDFYDMSTSQVQTFCEACAGDDECELAYA